MTPDPISKKATRSIRYGNLSCSQIDTTSTELSAGRLLRFTRRIHHARPTRLLLPCWFH